MEILVEEGEEECGWMNVGWCAAYHGSRASATLIIVWKESKSQLLGGVAKGVAKDVKRARLLSKEAGSLTPLSSRV